MGGNSSKQSEKPKIITDGNGEKRICYKEILSGRLVCQKSIYQTLASNISSPIGIIFFSAISIIAIGLIFYVFYSRKFKNQHKLLTTKDPEFGMRSQQNEILDVDFFLNNHKIPDSPDNWDNFQIESESKKKNAKSKRVVSKVGLLNIHKLISVEQNPYQPTTETLLQNNKLT